MPFAERNPIQLKLHFQGHAGVRFQLQIGDSLSWQTQVHDIFAFILDDRFVYFRFMRIIWSSDCKTKFSQNYDFNLVLLKNGVDFLKSIAGVRFLKNFNGFEAILSPCDRIKASGAI